MDGWKHIPVKSTQFQTTISSVQPNSDTHKYNSQEGFEAITARNSDHTENLKIG